MEINSKNILSFLKRKSDHPLKIKELAEMMKISKKDKTKFLKAIDDLMDDGTLVMLKRDRIGLTSEMDIKVGKIALTRSGTGFLLMEGDQQDILIPESALHTAMDGDKVMIRLGGFTGGRIKGTVIKVVERHNKEIVGIFNQGKSFAYVIPDNHKIGRDIYIPEDSFGGAREGERVVVTLRDWDDPHLNPEGEIAERLGFPGEPGVDIKTVIRKYSLPGEFTNEIMVAAEKIASDFDINEVKNREDLSNEIVYSIDPADAKDHDDAISVKQIKDGYELGVHIADVSYFVTEGSAIDKEALERGNSSYLPGLVIPMLPEILSNNICSLRVNEKRLAYSIIIEYDHKGKAKKWRLVDSIIESKAKLSYEEVQDFLDKKTTTKATDKVGENLLVARKLAKILSSRRAAEGSLDFDLPESNITLNKDGEVEELGNRVRLESHRLIEEFMLAANKIVAYEVLRRGEHFIYRVHDKPDKEKLQLFSTLMKSLGYNFSISPNMKPLLLAKFLRMVKDKPEADFINELMVRSMRKAVYQRENIGHFGLAFQYYTHFTSPIRRYPDLLVHRLLRKMKNGKYPPAFARKVTTLIDNISTHCSEKERNSEQAEREAIKAKQVIYMSRHVGDSFSGVVSGLTGFGMFVRLDDLGAEGMVRISSIDDDYYRYDEKLYQLKGSRHGRCFRMGDKVKVLVETVDTIKMEVNLNLVEDSSSSKKGKGKGNHKGNKKPVSKKKDASKLKSVRKLKPKRGRKRV